jgi:hypothetical protein
VSSAKQAGLWRGEDTEKVATKPASISDDGTVE